MPENTCEFYGSMVFNDRVMRERLPEPIYLELSKTIKQDAPLNI